MNPTRRERGLVATEVLGEVLVYDLERHRAHCLNAAATVVFRHCDGTRSVAQLATALARELGGEAATDRVWLALEALDRAHLLLHAGDRSPRAGRLSRRELVRRLGVAAALPIVTSVLAPTPAEAAATCVADCTGQAFGTPCSSTAPANCLCTCDGAGNCVGGC
jgi:hypothetical protein